MLIRLVLAVLVILILFYVLRQWRNTRTRQVQRKTVSADMLPCHQCGLHVPKQEAIVSANHYFCCEEHRLQYTKSH